MKFAHLASALVVASATAHDSNTTKPPYHPYSSVREYFTHSGINKTELDSEEMHCAVSGPNEKVFTISDGKHERCFVVVSPTFAEEEEKGENNGPLAVVYFAHGSGGNAGHCGKNQDLTGKTWIDIASENNFIFICGEALQYTAVNNETNSELQGGLWEIPEIFTDDTDQRCEDADSFDNTYMENLIATLAKDPETYDLSRFYITGCSMGSAFTVWQAPCLHNKTSITLSAFSTHSTGLKEKGDGLKFPPDTYNPEYSWGECPHCQWWPTVVRPVKDLKACIFDNTADPNEQEPYFYLSSKALVKQWAAVGNRAAETHYGSGGHCLQHSFKAIADCLDDGTGKLVPSGPAPTNCTDTAPDHNYTCAEQRSFGKCDRPWMKGFCCKTCFDCAAGCGH